MIFIAEYKDYKEKQLLLTEHFTPVSQRGFYDVIFPDNDLERAGHPEDQKPNMIIAHRISYLDRRTGEKRLGFENEIIFSGKEGLQKADKSEFALCGLCTYSGKRRTARNAFKCYGFAIDLDGVGKKECETYIMGMYAEHLPWPSYIVNSGHGLHLYFIFEQPIPLYPNVREHLNRLKRGITWAVWTNETSRIKNLPNNDKRQYQGIYQNMRMPGSCSKIGRGKAKTKYLVTAYQTNDGFLSRCTVSYLNRFVPDRFKAPEDPDYSSWDWDHLTLDEAQRLYPEWYEKRIVQKKPAGQWVSNRALYDWWLDKIHDVENVRDGNRYHCISVLFTMAIKCDISHDEVFSDAMDLVDFYDSLTEHPDNPFTKEDVLAASRFFKRQFARYSIRAIETRTGIQIKRREKPKNSQDVHLKKARAIRSVLGSYETVGRPDKSEIVRLWRKEHPEGRKTDCIRETGLSKHTVLKWWNSDSSE